MCRTARQRFQRFNSFLYELTQGCRNPGLQLANACGVADVVAKMLANAQAL
jgi:hypothetical protein